MNVFQTSIQPISVIVRLVYWMLLSFTLLSTLCLPDDAQQGPQDEVPLAPRRTSSEEAYRIRVENTMQGRVSVSVDSGLHYALIGRVTRPATTVQLERSAETPGIVLRSSGDGIAFTVSLGQVLKLRPTAPSSPNSKRGSMPASGEAGAIMTNIAPHSAIFADLTPPPDAPVKLEIAPRALRPFPTLYDPQQDEPIVIVVARPQQGIENREQGTGNSRNPIGNQQSAIGNPSTAAFLSSELLQQRVTALEQAYLAQSLVRARQEHRPVVAGVLNLKAKLPPGEPDPIAYVTYVVDGQIVSSQNVPPFNFEWDTRHETEGEHLVEVRALNRNNHVITSKRALLIVQNKAN